MGAELNFLLDNLHALAAGPQPVAENLDELTKQVQTLIVKIDTLIVDAPERPTPNA